MTQHVPETVKSLRRPDQAWIGGVCAGLSEQFHWPVLLTRALCVVLLGTSILGVVLYFAFWLVMPPKVSRDSMGLETASRAGMRSVPVQKWRAYDFTAATALLLLEIGSVWLLQRFGVGVDIDLLLPETLAGIGMGAIWWQADRASTPKSNETSWYRRLTHSLLSRWSTIAVVLIGFFLVVFAILFYTLVQTRSDPTQRVMLALILIIGSLVVAPLPWVVRIQRELHQALADR
jgi:phage shock protein PspC (stress-responsive transcriptional regulator)